MSGTNNAEIWVSLRQEVIKAVKRRLKETSDGRTLSRYRGTHAKYPTNEETKIARKNKENWEVRIRSFVIFNRFEYILCNPRKQK